MQKTTRNHVWFYRFIGFLTAAAAIPGYGSYGQKSKEIEIEIKAPAVPALVSQNEDDICIVGSYHEISQSPLRTGSFQTNFLKGTHPLSCAKETTDETKDSAPIVIGTPNTSFFLARGFEGLAITRKPTVDSFSASCPDPEQNAHLATGSMLSFQESDYITKLRGDTAGDQYTSLRDLSLLSNIKNENNAENDGVFSDQEDPRTTYDEDDFFSGNWNIIEERIQPFSDSD